MKILLIFPLCPLPAHSGGQVRVWNIAKQLSKKHSVSLVCFIRDESEKQYEKELLTVFHSVTFIIRRRLFDRSALLGNASSLISFIKANLSLLFATIFSTRPLVSNLYESSLLRDHIKMVDGEGRYDLFYAETFYGIASLKSLLPHLKTRLLLIDQNIESLAYKRQAAQQKNVLARLLMMLDVLKIKAEEVFFWKAATLVGALSEVDQQYIAQKSGRDVILLENGVDIAWFSERRLERRANEVLFVGTFSYFQNVDSLKWFLDGIWPKIAARSQQPLSLRIVGRRADASLKQYVTGKGVVIDESVEDIRDAFQRATILVAPIRAGSGTKYKVLEAMASHLPVVTTSVGAEGLAVTSSEELFIAENEDQFAEDVVTLIGDRPLQERVAETGFRFVEKRYDWDSIVSHFDETVLIG